MTLTSPMCPVGPMFKQAVESRVASMEGVKTTSVEITFTPPWDPRTMASDDAKVQLGISVTAAARARTRVLRKQPR